MLKKIEYNAVRVILLLVVIGISGYFVLSNVTDRSTQTAQIFPPLTCGATTAPYIKLLTPNTATTYDVGQVINITWKVCNMTGPFGIGNPAGATTIEITDDRYNQSYTTGYAGIATITHPSLDFNSYMGFQNFSYNYTVPVQSRYYGANPGYGNSFSGGELGGVHVYRIKLSVILMSGATYSDIGTTAFSIKAPNATTPAVPAIAPGIIGGDIYGRHSITDTSFRLQDYVFPNGLPTQVNVEYGTTTALGSTTPQVALSSTGIYTSNAIGTFSPNTLVYFRVKAQNSMGTVYSPATGVWSVTTRPSNGITVQPPLASTNVTNITSTSAKFHTTVNPNGYALDTKFFYSTDPISPYIGVSGLTSFVSSTTTLTSGTTATPVVTTVTGLTPNTTYYYFAWTNYYAVSQEYTFTTPQ